MIQFGRHVLYPRTAEEHDVIQGLIERDLAPLAIYLDCHQSAPKAIAQAIKLLINSNGIDLSSQLLVLKHPNSRQRGSDSERFERANKEIMVLTDVVKWMHEGKTFEIAVEAAADQYALSEASIKKIATRQNLNRIRESERQLAEDIASQVKNVLGN